MGHYKHFNSSKSGPTLFVPHVFPHVHGGSYIYSYRHPNHSRAYSCASVAFCPSHIFFFFFERWIMAVQISWVGPTWWWLPDRMKQSNESIWCMQTKTAVALKAGNFNWKERFSPPLKTPKSLVFCSFSKIPRFQFSPDRSQKKIGEEFSHSCIRIPSY